MQINKMALISTITIVVLLALGIYLLFYFTPSGTTLSSTNSQGITATITTATTTPTASSTPTEPTSTPQLGIQVIKPGTGPGAQTGDSITVNYTGTFTNGTVFDSSLNPGRTPFTFTLGGQVIQGWNQGLIGAKAGEELKLTVPPQLGYGPNQYQSIPGNSTLLFTITVLKIN